MSWLFGFSSKPTKAQDQEAASSSRAADVPLVRRARASRPTFSSTKCPPGPGLANSCELPFGFLWTPMAASTERTVIPCPTESLPPVLCRTCLAYLNKYCDVEYSQDSWTCALCGCKNVIPKKYLEGPEALLKPALIYDQVEYHQPLLALERKDDPDDICTMMLVIDRNLDASDGLGIIQALKKVLLNVGKDHPVIQLGLVVFDQAVAVYHLGRTDGDIASADIYPVQENQDDEARMKAMETHPYLQTIKSAADLDSVSRCLSVVFSSGKKSANGSKSMGKVGGGPSRMQLLKERKEARLMKNAVTPTGLTKVSPWVQASTAPSPKRCTGEALECAMDIASLRNCRTSRILLFTNGCPNMGEGSVVAEKSAKKNSKLPQGKKNKRHSSVDDVQIAAAIHYYDSLASLAKEEGIAIDVICAGWMELGLPAYQALVAPSGGYVVPQSSLDTRHLVQNLEFLLKHTFVSRTKIDMPPNKDVAHPPKKGLARFFRREATPSEETLSAEVSECVVDVRTDSFVVATHLVGPGELLDASAKTGRSSHVLKNEKTAFAEGLKLAATKDVATKDYPSAEALELSMTRIRIPRVDPLATISVVVQLNDTMEPEEDKFAFFQLTARSISRDGKMMITRVSTHRLPVADSISDYVNNVDDEVVSVLLAKNAVYRSVHGREETEDTKDKVVAGDPATLDRLAYEAQLDLDATIQRISGAFRLLGLEEKTKKMDLDGGPDQKKEVSVPPSSLELAFPPQLSGCLHRLYHLRRGALISPGPLRSVDDRADVRQLFLRFTLEDCLGMMAPKLWSTGYVENSRDASNMTSMTPFPAETMALWDAVCTTDLTNIGFRGLTTACCVFLRCSL